MTSWWVLAASFQMTWLSLSSFTSPLPIGEAVVLEVEQDVAVREQMHTMPGNGLIARLIEQLRRLAPNTWLNVACHSCSFVPSASTSQPAKPAGV